MRAPATATAGKDQTHLPHCLDPGVLHATLVDSGEPLGMAHAAVRVLPHIVLPPLGTVLNN